MTVPSPHTLVAASLSSPVSSLRSAVAAGAARSLALAHTDSDWQPALSLRFLYFASKELGERAKLHWSISGVILLL